MILFCIFYSRIQAASQSKKGLYFSNFRDFFPTGGFYWDLFQIQKACRLYPKMAIKSLTQELLEYLWRGDIESDIYRVGVG